MDKQVIPPLHVGIKKNFSMQVTLSKDAMWGDETPMVAQMKGEMDGCKTKYQKGIVKQKSLWGNATSVTIKDEQNNIVYDSRKLFQESEPFA